MNGAVRADRHGDAQGVDGLEGTDGHGNDFVGDASLAKRDGLFDCDFIKGVHRHFGELDIHTGMIGKRAHLDLGVHHALDSDQDLHQKLQSY